MKIQEKSRREVLTGNLWKVVFSITLPIFLYQFINSFYNLIDQIMVSSISASSVSAVATIAQIKNLISSLGAGIVAGGAILVSRAYGEGNIAKSRKYANVLFTLCLIVIAFVLLLMPFSTGILQLAQVPEDLISISKNYFLLQLVEQGFLVYNTFFIGLEKSKCNTGIILWSNLAVMTSKIVLNAVFIYGFKVENLLWIELSSILSQMIMTIIASCRIFREKEVIYVSWKELSLKWEYVKKIVLISFPIFLGKFVISLGKVTVNAMCKFYGSLTVGALGISNNICGVITGPNGSFEDSESAIVSMNVGNKNMKRCLKTFLISCVYMAVWAVAGFLVVRVFFENQIISLFNMKNSGTGEEFVAMIKEIFVYDCLTIPALAINSSILGLLYGYGQTFLATINNVLRIITRITVLAVLQNFYPDLGAQAAGISMGISNVVIAFMAVIFLIIFLVKTKIKGYHGMRFSDKEPEMEEVNGILVNKENEEHGTETHAA